MAKQYVIKLDWSGIYSDDKVIMAHERLAIVDLFLVSNLY
jgi:hypothetical protein